MSSHNFIYIYTTNKLEKKDIFFIKITKQYIIDEILEINKKNKPYIYYFMEYDIKLISIEKFNDFLKLVLECYFVEKTKKDENFVYDYKVLIKGVNLVDKIKTLLDLINNNFDVNKKFNDFLNNNITIDINVNNKLTSKEIKNKFLELYNLQKDIYLNNILNSIINEWILKNRLITKYYSNKNYTVKYIHNISFKK